MGAEAQRQRAPAASSASGGQRGDSASGASAEGGRRKAHSGTVGGRVLAFLPRLALSAGVLRAFVGTYVCRLLHLKFCAAFRRPVTAVLPQLVQMAYGDVRWCDEAGGFYGDRRVAEAIFPLGSADNADATSLSVSAESRVRSASRCLHVSSTCVA